MSGRDSRSTQTTTTTLPAGQQRNVDTLLRGALDFFNSGGRQFFPGDVVADFDPLQTQGQNAVVNFASGVGSDLVSDSINANSLFLDPNNLFNPGNIPGFQGSVDDITNTFMRALTEGILPSIRAGGTASGQFGGSASGIGQALATDRATENLGDSLSQLYLGAYGQGLDSFNRAIDRAPGLFNFGTAPGSTIAGVGGQRQGQAQDEIRGQVARHEFEQNEPIMLLNLLRDLTGQAGTFGGTQETQATQRAGTSPVNQALGGALALASLWNPALSLFGGLGGGAAAGGAATGLGPITPALLA